MSILRKHRKANLEETDLDMVPIMNMFLVLIPFLLMSASFFHLKAINTSVPILADTSEAAEGGPKKEIIKVTVVIEISEKLVDVTVLSDAIAEDKIRQLEQKINRTTDESQTMALLAGCLEKIKTAFPASDTVILIPEEEVVYDTIIQTMDVARYYNQIPLFPKVVLSGKVG